MLLAAAMLACACGDSREEPVAAPAPEPAAAEIEPADETAGSMIGLSDGEHRRLEKQFAAEAIERITAKNAAAVGERLLDEVERELAAELEVAVDAGTD